MDSRYIHNFMLSISKILKDFKQYPCHSWIETGSLPHHQMWEIDSGVFPKSFQPLNRKTVLTKGMQDYV